MSCHSSSSSRLLLLLPTSSSSSPSPLPSKRLSFPPPAKTWRRFTISALKIGVEEIAELAHNKVLVASFVAGAIGQLSKPLTSVISGKGVDLKAAVRAGGMPSTHSAGVVAAATSLGLERGFSDSIFGMSAVFAALVMYDAQGVRREVGYHAKILNQILSFRQDSPPSWKEDNTQPRISSINSEEISSFVSVSEKANSYESSPESYSLQRSAVASIEKDALSLKVKAEDPLQKFSNYKSLNESVGHTEVQVLVGALLGFVVSVVIEAIL